MGSWRIGRQETGTLAMTLSFSKAKRAVLGAVAALTLGAAMVGSTAPAEAQWRGHWGGGWGGYRSAAWGGGWRYRPAYWGGYRYRPYYGGGGGAPAAGGGARDRRPPARAHSLAP